MSGCGSAVTPTRRRDDFWSPFTLPGTVFGNAPDDGHMHDYHLISPKTMGAYGPTGRACLKCGWFKSWGELT